jgi:hypothetical protein
LLDDISDKVDSVIIKKNRIFYKWGVKWVL